MDIGCGHGRDLEYFINKGFHAVGIDNSKELLKIAHERSNADLIELDIRNISALQQKFKGIWANAVLHHLHIDDIEKVCIDMANLLSPGGVLFISVKAKITDHWDSKYPNFPRHYTSIEKTFLENCLYSAGFNITKSKIIAEDLREIHTMFKESHHGVEHRMAGETEVYTMNINERYSIIFYFKRQLVGYKVSVEERAVVDYGKIESTLYGPLFLAEHLETFRPYQHGDRISPSQALSQRQMTSMIELLQDVFNQLGST